MMSPKMFHAGPKAKGLKVFGRGEGRGTGMRSDLLGQISAQVTGNVYDSPTGHILLVQQGTRIIGQHDNNVGFGQSRVLLAWNRLIFPKDRSIVPERRPGADSEGYAWRELSHWASLSTGPAVTRFDLT